MKWTEQERKAVSEIFASGIACIIDIGRAIKNGNLEDRMNAVAHAETFVEQIAILQADESR